MQTLSIITLTALAAGCNLSHPMGGNDAGPDVMADAAGPVADAGMPAPDASLGPIACTGEWTGSGVDTPCFCQGPFAVAGDLAYRASYDLGVIDLSRPEAPRLVRSVPLSRTSSEGGVAIAGGALVVAGFGIEIFDLSDPSTPVSTGLLPDIDESLYAQDAVAYDRYVLVTLTRDFREGVLLVIDPAAAAIRARLDLPGAPRRIAVAGTHAYAGVREGGVGEDADSVIVIDLADPERPAQVGRVPVAARAILGPVVAAQGTSLFVAGGGGGTPLLERYDLTRPREPRLVSAVPAEDSFVTGLVTAGDLLFALGAGRVFDLRDPHALRPAGTFPSFQGQFGRLVGDHLVLSSGGHLGSARIDCER